MSAARMLLRLVRGRLLEVIRAVAPLVLVGSVLQVTIAGAPAALFGRFLAGSALAVLGMMLLLAGVELGILPMGRFIGAELPRKGSVALVLGVAFALGFATTLAEPDVLVLVGQVDLVSEGETSGRGLALLMATGVGLFAALALLRVLAGFSMAWLLTGIYGAMILLSFLAPAGIVPIAYDAGSVTTGVLTAPVVLALALGLSSVLANRSAVSDGFGLLGLAATGPVLVILLLGALRP